MRKRTSLSLIISAQLFVGCSPQEFTSIRRLHDVDEGRVIQKTRPTCEVPEVDYQLEAQVTAFEVTKDKNTKFGFNGLLKWLNFEASFKVKHSTLSVRTDVREFLKPFDPLGSANASRELKEKESGFQFELWKISAGHSSYSKTPFYDLMKRTLNDSFSQTAQKLREVESLWKTAIVAIPSATDYIIPAGANAGIQVGDEFAVFNVRHYWAGVPCESKYIYGDLTTDTAIAILQVKSGIDLHPNAALLTIKERLRDDDIEEGAVILVQRLVNGRKPNSLKRSVAIREVMPFKVIYTQNNSEEISVDFTKYLKDAIDPIVSEKNFYIKSLEQH